MSDLTYTVLKRFVAKCVSMVTHIHRVVVEVRSQIAVPSSLVTETELSVPVSTLMDDHQAKEVAVNLRRLSYQLWTASFNEATNKSSSLLRYSKTVRHGTRE